MALLQDKKVLVLHPFLNFHGGAEYLLSVVVNEIVPQADIFTFAYNRAVLKRVNIAENRVTAPVNNLLSGMYRQLTPLYPAIIDSLELDKYDVLLSFSYAYVHGIVTSHKQLHVAYIHTPMRLLWAHESDYYIYSKVPLVREVYNSILTWQRLWDKQAGRRPDYLLANSREIASQSQHIWGVNPEVIYPPVNVDFYAAESEQTKKEDYYITHSRLVRYKRIDILIEAAKKSHQKLLVVGDGPDYKRLKRIANGDKDIIFTGYVSEDEKRKLLQQAKGFWFASKEDFGIAPVEAMAAGIPVLAFDGGGATETLTDEVGTFFSEQSVDSLCEMLPKFEKQIGQIKQRELQNRAKLFSKEVFVKKYSERINALVREHNN